MTSFFRFLLVSLAFTLGTINFSHAASFDCSKATTETEIAICNDPELSLLDDLVSISYRISRETSLDKTQILNAQRIWIVERDKIRTEFDQERYSNWQDNLYYFMLERVVSLFEGSIGINYRSIFEIIENAENISFDFDKSHRVILFYKNQRKRYEVYRGKRHDVYHGALFFDQRNNLKKVFMGDIYGKGGSACENSFAFFEDTNTKITSLYYTMSCGNSGRHGVSQTTYMIASDCINLKSHKKISGQFGINVNDAGDWSLNENKEICLEEQNYNFGTDGLLFGTRGSEKHNSLGGLLSFFTDYWTEPPVQSVGPQFEGCSSSPRVLTDVKLTNLYTILANFGTFLNRDILKVPNDTGFVGYQEISTSRYAEIIADYEKNKKTYDLFLPVIKILDTDGNLKEWVSGILKSREGGDVLPRNNDCQWFQVTNGDFYRNTYFRSHGGFWQRRKMDGTTDQTLEILRKLQKVLAN